MQNLDFVAQAMSELCSILQFFGHFVFGGHLVFQKCFPDNLFGLFIQNSLQNLDSVTQEMSELCSLYYSVPSRPDHPTYTSVCFGLDKNRSKKSCKARKQNHPV